MRAEQTKTVGSVDVAPTETSGRASVSRPGRKRVGSSRLMEFRQALSRWKDTPESMRPSLRQLAEQLGTTHQLLTYCLKRLGKWQAKDDWRRNEGIREKARSEGRSLTPYEEHDVRLRDRRAMSLFCDFALQRQLEKLKKKLKTGVVNYYDVKTLKLLARHYPEAREILAAGHYTVRKRRPFREIVKSTPRRDGEDLSSWIHRIFDECNNCGAKTPGVIDVKDLEAIAAEGTRKKPVQNLPLSDC